MTSIAAPMEATAETASRARRIRVLKFVTLFAVGGTEGQVMAMANGLDPARFDLHMACHRRTGEWLARGGALLARPPAEYGISNLYGWRSMGARRRFAGDVRRARIDVVHTYGFYPNVFAIWAARAARVPAVIASIRDMGVYLTARQMRVQRLACRLAHRVVVNAEAIERWLIDGGYPASRIRVIPNGVDLARFGPRGDAASLAAELGIPGDGPLVAVVSRLSPKKGLEDFLRAAAIVSTTRPDARFLVVGPRASDDGGYGAGLETLARDLGLGARCVFTGLRDDVPAVLARATVSVLPSHSEGLSNALLESMAAGAPVVATRVGGTAEAVQDGASGLIVAPGEPASLAAGIERLLASPDLAARLGDAARRRVAERFSSSAAIASTARLYEDVLAGRAA